MTNWSSKGSGTRFEILLVEDDPAIVQIIEKGFQSADSDVRLETFSNGYDALYFLKERSSTESPSLPDLALLGLNVPGKDGCEILSTIKGDPQLRRLPTIILTSSESREDVARCYDAHANAYVTKPEDADEFAGLIEVIERFWIDRVQLPPPSK